MSGTGTDVSFVVTDMIKTDAGPLYRPASRSLPRRAGRRGRGPLGADGIFVADHVLAKHDENYMPKDVADRLKEKGVWQEGMGAGP